MEMIMTAGMIDANQALQYGLVNHVTTQEELLEFTEKIAGTIMKISSTDMKLKLKNSEIALAQKILKKEHRHFFKREKQTFLENKQIISL